MTAWNNVLVLVEVKPKKSIGGGVQFGPYRPKLGLKVGFLTFSQVEFIIFLLNSIGQ